MIREKGEALSPVKINRNVWSNSAARVKGLFTVSGAPLGLQPTGFRPARRGGCEREKQVRKEKMVIKKTQNEGEKRAKKTRWQSQAKYCHGWKPAMPPNTLSICMVKYTHVYRSFSSAFSLVQPQATLCLQIPALTYTEHKSTETVALFLHPSPLHPPSLLFLRQQ